MLSCLLLLFAWHGDDHAAASGTVLPNKDELVRTFKEHQARFLKPLDNYYLHMRRERGAFDTAETITQVNMPYFKSYSRDGCGVERVEVVTPTETFNLTKLPFDAIWRLADHRPLDQARKQAHQNRISLLASISYSFGVPTTTALFEDPGWTIHKVTTERTNDLSVYRFHFSYKTTLAPGFHPSEIAFNGTVDVAPSLSWAIVKTTKTYDPRARDVVTETVYTYEGTIHGLPAPKRIESRNHGKAADGQIESYPLYTTDVLEFREQSEINPSEFSLSHYGLGPPYLAYGALLATALLALGWCYAIAEWSRIRRRRGLSWATAGD